MFRIAQAQKTPPDNQAAAKNLTHTEILELGNNLLDEREVFFEHEKQRAIADAQLALTDNLKLKYEKEIVRQIQKCKSEHEVEINNMLARTEERVAAEISKREAKLQTEMSEQLRNLQDKMSREMQTALEESKQKHEMILAEEIQRTVVEKEAESVLKLEGLRLDFEKEKLMIKQDLEKIAAEKVTETERLAEAKRVESLAEQDKKFKSQMSTVLQELQTKHTENIKLEKEEVRKREEYITKLHSAIDFLRQSRQELIDITIGVHEQMKFFVDKTKPFTDGTAQYLVPRLDLSKFSEEPDTAWPYLISE